MLNIPLILWIVQSVIAFLCGLNLLLDSYVDKNFITRMKHRLITWIVIIVLSFIPVLALIVIWWWASALHATHNEEFPPFYLKSILSKEF